MARSRERLAAEQALLSRLAAVSAAAPKIGQPCSKSCSC
ncbi:hypothetical protein ACS15_3535 [Ralstonia insidiosa]|uniref:Uncharacterized protein n=1 Tax=Ralstonia insidiosa TaxID=190721 RepID=A0AAC9FQA0_9RALS|nr:hypothetical protein ACS15_3535 [Ralstonia insidiosa]